MALLCVLFAGLAQIASNFGNEYYDFKNGIDNYVAGETNITFTDFYSWMPDDKWDPMPR